MAQKISSKTTFEPGRVISPLYTGGSVALSRDGRVLATCLGEDALLTDLVTGQRLAQIEGDGEVITTLILTPSASHLIICSRSLSMRIFALDRSSSSDHITAELVRTLKPHPSPVVTSAVDHTGTLLATGAADGIVKVWDIRGGYTTHTLHGHSGVVSALHFFEVTATSQAQEVGQSSKKKKKRKLADVDAEAAEENDDGTAGFRLASGSEDGQIRIWNLQKRKCAAVLDSHVSVVRSLEFNAEENVFLSGSRDKTIMLWDAATWKLRNTIPVLEGVEACGFLAQTGLVYTGGETGRLRLWWSRTGEEATEEQEVGGEGQGITDIIHGDTLPFLLSIHANQNLRLHSLEATVNLKSGSQIPALAVVRHMSGTHDEVIDLAYVGSDQSLLAVATNLEDIRILSLKDSAADSTTADPTTIMNGAYFGADVGVLTGHSDIIICLDVDWSGHWLATGAKDNTARLWRIDSSQNSFTHFATFSGHAESLGAVALPKTLPPVGSPAHSNPLEYPPPFLITGSQDKTIKRWDTSSIQASSPDTNPRATYTRKAHDKDINALDINHSSLLFASASQDRTVKIWSLLDGEPVGVLRGHKRGVWTVKFAPKDTQTISSEVGNGGQQASSARGYVLTGSGDKTVKIWSLADYSCLRTFEGHTNSVLKVLWMHPVTAPPPQKLDDGDDNDDDNQRKNTSHTKPQPPQIASAGGDGLVKIWDAVSGELACTLDNHTDRVWALAQPSPSSSSTTTTTTSTPPTALTSGGGDGVLTFWTNTTSTTLSHATQASTLRLEQDQRLQNLIRTRSYREAISLALSLDHPARLLGLFSAAAAETSEAERGSLTGVRAVDDVVANLGDELLWRLLGRCREWNGNAKTAWVAQRVLCCIFKHYPASRITGLRGAPARVVNPTDTVVSADDRDAEGGTGGAKAAEATATAAAKTKSTRRGGGGGVKDMLDGIRAYTERHYRRLEELVDESFLVEYTLREMDEVGGVSLGQGGRAPGEGEGRGEGDVDMISV